MENKNEEFSPIKTKSILELQNLISQTISDFVTSKYTCKIDKIEYLDWNKVNINLTLDGSLAFVEDIAEGRFDENKK